MDFRAGSGEAVSYTHLDVYKRQGLFGFVGMIIAVPAFAVIYDLIARAVHFSLKNKKLSMATEDYKDLDHIDEKDGRFIK